MKNLNSLTPFELSSLTKENSHISQQHKQIQTGPASIFFSCTENLNDAFIENKLRTIGHIMRNIDRINTFKNDREEGGDGYIQVDTIIGIMDENNLLFNDF